jgi:hypothetical protein
MKNAIIVILALLCIAPELKSYIGRDLPSGLQEAIEQDNTLTRRTSDEFTEMDGNAMIRNFSENTLPKIRSGGLSIPRLERPEGPVTQSVTFNVEDIKRHMEMNAGPTITFHLASFDAESAKKYVKMMKLSDSDITLIVQKPTVILKSKENMMPNARVISIVGQICPPPTSCP